jgi:hypothetical protein
MKRNWLGWTLATLALLYLLWRAFPLKVDWEKLSRDL